MGLTNSQFQAIEREYEQIRRSTRYEMDDRLSKVREEIPGYSDLEKEIISLSVKQGKKAILGDTNALSELHLALDKLRNQKAYLLSKYQFPANYLDPIYQCPLCKDTGYIEQEKCTCLKQKITALLYSQYSIRESLKTENFSSLSYDYYKGEDLARFQSTVADCKKFIKNFNSDYRNLFFYGTVGTGKSFLSGCIAKELIEQGNFVLYFSAANFFDRLADQVFHRQNQDSFLEDITTCDLLIIDDLGTEVTTQFVSSAFFSNINERHLNKKSTIISTNFSLQEIRDRYSDRLFSRITGNYDLYKISGPDIRILKKSL